MVFWCLLDVVLILLSFIGIVVGENTIKDAIFKSICLILFIVSAFRYNLATDYSEYVAMYYASTLEDIKLYPEISFTCISVLLKSLGLSFQSLFVFYSALSLFFFIKALNYWTDRIDARILAVAFFSMSIFYGFWESMNTIRQTAAAFVLFYGFRYLFERKYIKFVCFVCFASFFHYSALICLVSFFLPLNLSKCVHVFIVLTISIIFSLFGIENIFYWVFAIVGRGESYASLNPVTGSGLGILYFLLFCFFSVLYSGKSNKEIFCCSMLTYGIAVKIMFLNIDVIGRLSQYWFVFVYVSVVLALQKFSNKHTYIVAFIFLAGLCYPMHIYMLNNEETSESRLDDRRGSAGNISYSMNFKIMD